MGNKSTEKWYRGIACSSACARFAPGFCVPSHAACIASYFFCFYIWGVGTGIQPGELYTREREQHNMHCTILKFEAKQIDCSSTQSLLTLVSAHSHEQHTQSARAQATPWFHARSAPSHAVTGHFTISWVAAAVNLAGYKKTGLQGANDGTTAERRTCSRSLKPQAAGAQRCAVAVVSGRTAKHTLAHTCSSGATVSTYETSHSALNSSASKLRSTGSYAAVQRVKCVGARS